MEGSVKKSVVCCRILVLFSKISNVLLLTGTFIVLAHNNVSFTFRVSLGLLMHSLFQLISCPLCSVHSDFWYW